jgi:hypothetical protein
MAVEFSTTRVRPDLDILTESFSFRGQRFAADSIFPIYEAEADAAQFDKEIVGVGADLDTDASQRREAGGRFRGIDHETRKDQFATGERGLEQKIDRRKGARNARMRRKKEETAARNLYLRVQRGRELAVINKTVNNVQGKTASPDFTLANKNYLNAGTTFGATTDILSEITRAVHAFEDLCGQSPHGLMIPRQDWRTISTNEGVRGAFGSDLTKPALITTEMLREIFGVEEIISPFVSYNARARGSQASMANMWPSGLLLFYLATPDEDLTPVQLGRTIVNGEEGSCGAGMFGSYSDDPHHSETLWYGQDRDVKLLNANAGLILNTTAA